ncbi:flagellar hook-associated family protein [Aliihoeflea aestuarii]|jgi:flagellar hook-associated protein 3 FlgL|uniref:flagellar hook-associated family protein n=1 Tax=Aliihoeflea aestuarii TaxID=453840 RepID=UPI0020953604|nr:flagellar hook-associated family protein [Aliihoeflea aestuarii]MCO6392901.1 flagellar hook-associated family protein [Aliihoeflea aestuarii]
MKMTSVSTNAISQALRLQVARAQAEMIKAQKEVVTGQVADRGLHIGIRTGQSVSLDRDIARLQNIKDTNAIVSSRMVASQEAMGQVHDYAQTFMETLTTSIGGTLDPKVLQTQASTMLATMASAANTTIAGEFIFAGTNTDIRPFDDFLAPDSSSRAAMDEWFGDFLASIGNPEPSALTPDQVGEFLDQLETHMSGDGWQDAWSQASDQQITSRITLNETAQTSVTVNDIGLRQFSMAAAAMLTLTEAGIGPDAMRAMNERAITWTAAGMNQMTASRASLGIVEGRVSQASERLSMQADLFTNMQRDMIGVDEYEAGTRLTALIAQADAALLLTTRIQQISLLKYL